MAIAVKQTVKEVVVMIDGNRIPIKLYYSKRKTISVEIKHDGVSVRAPLRMSDAEIQSFLERKKDWLQKHLQKQMERKAAVKDLQPYTHEELNDLADKALQVIPARVKYYADAIGVDYGRITIRNQRTRWGSCSSKGNLNFNCLLMLMPDDIIDSVIVHELCHRKHMNHSAQFYAEVEKAFPDYQRCRKWLKENGGIYLCRLP